jgi:hypothetical protein
VITAHYHLAAIKNATSNSPTTGTKLTIDHDGTGISNNSVTIILKNVTYTTDLLTNLNTNGNLALDSIQLKIPLFLLMMVIFIFYI